MHTYLFNVFVLLPKITYSRELLNLFGLTFFRLVSLEYFCVTYPHVHAKLRMWIIWCLRVLRAYDKISDHSILLS